VIRKPEEKDWPAVHAILSHSIQTSNANFSWQPPDFDSFIKEQKQIAKSYPYLVAEHEGKVIGFGYLHPWLAKDAYWMNLELTIYFQPGPHYHMASEMLLALEEEAKLQGYMRLVSCITADNAQSIAYHQKHGFQFFGRLEDAGWKEGWQSVVWMYKNLAAFTKEKPEKALQKTQPKETDGRL
jgi:phosphinothricin acetyltransferase